MNYKVKYNCSPEMYKRAVGENIDPSSFVRQLHPGESVSLLNRVNKFNWTTTNDYSLFRTSKGEIGYISIQFLEAA